MIIEQLSLLVWDFRGKYQEFWPTPNRRYAFLFAITEMAEAIDAMIRNEPRFKRNSLKTIDPMDEWADTAMMLITAMPYVGRFEYAVSTIPIDDIPYLMGRAAKFSRDGLDKEAEIDVATILKTISQFYEEDGLLRQVSKRLARIHRKHVYTHLWGPEANRWANKWPDYCRSCKGQGVFVDHYDPAPRLGGLALAEWHLQLRGTMVDVEFCPKCLGEGFCPRCGEFQWTEDELEDTDNTPCNVCGWNWAASDGDFMPEPPEGKHLEVGVM